MLGEGRLFVISAKPGDTYAVRPGGTGDVSDTHRLWHTPRKRGRILASPILEGNILLTVSMEGFAYCYDTATGREFWSERLDGRFTASPLAAKGLFYLLSEFGKMLVIKPAESLQIIATNDLGAGDGETFRGSPVPTNGQFLVRSNQAVYCIGRP